MNILAWIIIGGVAGWIGSLIAKTDASQGILMNIFIGIIGAFIGGLLFNFFGAAGVTGFNLYSLVVSTVGATALLFIVRAVRTA